MVLVIITIEQSSCVEESLPAFCHLNRKYTWLYCPNRRRFRIGGTDRRTCGWRYTQEVIVKKSARLVWRMIGYYMVLHFCYILSHWY